MSLPLLVGAEIPSCHAERSEASGRRKISGRRINSRPRSFAVAQDDRIEGREKIAVLHPLFYLRAAVEIQTCELAEQFYSHIIVRNRGIFLIVIIADMNPVVFVTDFCFPFASLFMPANAFIPADAAVTGKPVLCVLCRRTDADVAPAVV